MRFPFRRAALAGAAVLVVSSAQATPAAADDTVADPAQYVNPFVGTAPGGADFGHGGGAGNTFPGATAPSAGCSGARTR